MSSLPEGEKFQDQGKITVDVCAGKTKLMKNILQCLIDFHL